MRAPAIIALCLIVSILLVKLLLLLSGDALSVVIVSLVALATVSSWLAGMWWSVSATGRVRLRQ